MSEECMHWREIDSLAFQVIKNQDVANITINNGKAIVENAYELVRCFTEYAKKDQEKESFPIRGIDVGIEG